MNDRHEQSRAAFEAVHHDFSHSWDDGKKQYRDIHTMMYWDTWCRALDYAAEQQAKQCQCDMRTKLVGDGCSVCNPEKAKEYMDDEAPTPLTRPDRPGWWWEWDGEKWVKWDIYKQAGKPGLGAWCDGIQWQNPVEEGLWLPATPPPAPRSTQDQ